MKRFLINLDMQFTDGIMCLQRSLLGEVWGPRACRFGSGFPVVLQISSEPEVRRANNKKETLQLPPRN